MQQVEDLGNVSEALHDHRAETFRSNLSSPHKNMGLLHSTSGTLFAASKKQEEQELKGLRLRLQMTIKEYRDQLYDNIIARRKQLRKAEKEKYGLAGKSFCSLL